MLIGATAMLMLRQAVRAGRTIPMIQFRDRLPPAHPVERYCEKSHSQEAKLPQEGGASRHCTGRRSGGFVGWWRLGLLIRSAIVAVSAWATSLGRGVDAINV